MSYELQRTCWIDEISSTGFLFEHKSGAKLMVIKNNDKNRVFSMSFKTPPSDNKGAAHIVEHCVLCGSRKYPLKDPFNELAKASRYTYLNAMTFKDKTMYPVAGCSYPDFLTMIDVYLDGVFFPLLNREEIFWQEGWRRNSDGSFGGIVLNEMKGIYSDLSEALQKNAYHCIFPDSCYRYDAAGRPDEIIKLSYEDFLEFYQKHYAPSNCYMYLYGDLDAEDIMNRIDGYIKHFDRAPEISIEEVRVADKIVFHNDFFQSATDGSHIIGSFYPVGKVWDRKLTMAWKVIKDYLLKAPSSPLKSAVTREGGNIAGYLDTEITDIVFGAVCKDSPMEVKKLSEMITESLERILSRGLDESTLRSCIHQYEFELKEENYGYRPKGLAYYILMTTNWLYGRDPFEKMKRLQTLEEIKGSGQGYFEQVIRDKLLNNSTAAHVCISSGSGSKKIFIPLSSAEKKEIEQQTKQMTAMHNAVDSLENLQSIPIFLPTAEDIELTAVKIDRFMEGNITMLRQHIETNGIVYIDLVFDISTLPCEMLPYVSILAYVLGKIPTSRYNTEQLRSGIDNAVGGLEFYTDCYFSSKTGESVPVFIISGKALSWEVKEIFVFIEEIINRSLLKEQKAMKGHLQAHLLHVKNSFINAGELVIPRRAASFFSHRARRLEEMKGLPLYILLKKILSNFHEHFEMLYETLSLISRFIFQPQHMTASMAGENENYERYVANICQTLSACAIPRKESGFAWNTKTEGIQTPSKVCHNAMAFDYQKEGQEYSGIMAVAAEILSGDYFMKELRLKGSAYGCGCGFRRDGSIYFYSIWDPHLESTIKVFQKAGEFLCNYNETGREFDKYIIGACHKLLRPQHPETTRKITLARYFSHIDEDDLRKELAEILQADRNQIRTLANCFFRQEHEYFCSAGSEEILSCYPFEKYVVIDNF